MGDALLSVPLHCAAGLYAEAVSTLQDAGMWRLAAALTAHALAADHLQVWDKVWNISACSKCVHTIHTYAPTAQEDQGRALRRWAPPVRSHYSHQDCPHCTGVFRPCAAALGAPPLYTNTLFTLLSPLHRRIVAALFSAGRITCVTARAASGAARGY